LPLFFPNWLLFLVLAYHPSSSPFFLNVLFLGDSLLARTVVQWCCVDHISIKIETPIQLKKTCCNCILAAQDEYNKNITNPFFLKKSPWLILNHRIHDLTISDVSKSTVWSVLRASSCALTLRHIFFPSWFEKKWNRNLIWTKIKVEFSTKQYFKLLTRSNRS